MEKELASLIKMGIVELLDKDEQPMDVSSLTVEEVERLLVNNQDTLFKVPGEHIKGGPTLH